MRAQQAPLANTITLGVRDFAAQRSFYSRLGWPLAFDSDDFAVFELRGALLALFPFDKLAVDARARAEPGAGGIRFSIIIGVDEPGQVDELAARIEEAGGTLTKPPTDAEFFAGRDAYFTDPEGNFWEIAFAPSDNPVTAAARRAAGLPPLHAPRPARRKIRKAAAAPRRAAAQPARRRR
jgi:predicted lactoylglutathione lyase